LIVSAVTLALQDTDATLRIRKRRPMIVAATQPRRTPLPDHLPREDVVLDINGKTCPYCGGALRSMGETLDWVPAQLRALRIARPNTSAAAATR
jgi:transposase